MTIAASFRASDSIILCADTEVTIGADLKLMRGKVKIYRADDFKLVMAGAGNSDFISMATDKIGSAIGNAPTHYEIYRAIEKVILEIFSKHVRFAPEEHGKPNFDLLISVWTPDEGLELYKTSGTAIIRGGWCECLGWGAALGSYIADKKYSILLDERECIGLAIYILRQAKDYVPYCGKESSVYILRSDGEIKSASSSKVVDQEEYFDEFEQITNDVFMAGYLETDDDEFEGKIKDFSDGLRRLRERQKKERENENIFSALFGPKS